MAFAVDVIDRRGPSNEMYCQSQLNKNKVKQGRPMMIKRKLDGAVDESSADQEIRKSNLTLHNL